MKLFQALLATFLFSVSVTASAGATFSHDVDFGDDFLHGGVSAADKSSDTKQYIGCYINAFQSNNVVICVARNASGSSKTCMNTSPTEGMLNSVASISNASFISATINDSGVCTRILTHSNSAFIE